MKLHFWPEKGLEIQAPPSLTQRTGLWMHKDQEIHRVRKARPDSTILLQTREGKGQDNSEAIS